MRAKKLSYLTRSKRKSGNRIVLSSCWVTGATPQLRLRNSKVRYSVDRIESKIVYLVQKENEENEHSSKLNLHLPLEPL